MKIHISLKSGVWGEEDIHQTYCLYLGLNQLPMTGSSASQDSLQINAYLTLGTCAEGTGLLSHSCPSHASQVVFRCLSLGSWSSTYS